MILHKFDWWRISKSTQNIFNQKKKKNRFALKKLLMIDSKYDEIISKWSYFLLRILVFLQHLFLSQILENICIFCING